MVDIKAVLCRNENNPLTRVGIEPTLVVLFQKINRLLKANENKKNNILPHVYPRCRLYNNWYYTYKQSSLNMDNKSMSSFI